MSLSQRTFSKKVLDGVETLIKTQAIQEKRSLSSLYIGTLLGALSGVLGNFFASLWFQKFTLLNPLGLIGSGTLLVVASIALFLQAKKYAA